MTRLLKRLLHTHWLRLAAIMALALALLPAYDGAGSVHAQTTAQTWDVQVGGGGDQPAGAPPTWEADAYGPDPLIIHPGDTVRWTFAGAHTVTFNSGKPELPLVVPGPTPGTLALGPGYFPAGITGTSGTYDGTQQVSSGFQAPGSAPVTFSLTFTTTGTFGYVCMLHPGMRGNIEVREATAILPETPAAAVARGKVTRTTLTGKVKSTAQALRPTDSGTVHAAQVGVGNAFGASALAFINGDRTVNRGDTMVWTNTDPFEIHTVTFTSGGKLPDFVTPQPQSSGPPLLVIPANVVAPTGDTYTGTGFFNSGILSAGSSFAAKIDAPAGAYDYFCVVHPWMKGTITVRG